MSTTYTTIRKHYRSDTDNWVFIYVTAYVWISPGTARASTLKGGSYDIMINQDPHQHINRKIAGNVDTDKIGFAIFHLAGIAVKIQYQPAHAARDNNNTLVINKLKAIARTLKKAAEVFNMPIRK